MAGLAGAVLGALGVHFWRGLPWSLAGIVGVAIGVLVIASLRSGERVRAVWRDGADSDRS